MISEWNNATDKLIEQTRAGSVVWRAADDFPARDPEDRLVMPAYVAEVAGKRIAVYGYWYREYLDYPDVWNFEQDVAIEFVDHQNRREWLWPGTIHRAELLDAIQQQLSGANQFLRDFVGLEKN